MPVAAVAGWTVELVVEPTNNNRYSKILRDIKTWIWHFKDRPCIKKSVMINLHILTKYRILIAAASAVESSWFCSNLAASASILRVWISWDTISAEDSSSSASYDAIFSAVSCIMPLIIHTLARALLTVQIKNNHQEHYKCHARWMTRERELLWLDTL